MKYSLIFLAKPGEIFEQLKLNARWVGPCILVVLGLTTENWIMSCWRTQTLTFNMITVLMTAVLITILIAFSWTFISVLLYWSIYLINTTIVVIYRKVFSIVSYCGLIFFISEITNLLLLQTQFIDSSHYILPNRFPIGLDILFLGRSLHPAYAILLYSINPFTIWYFTVLSIGLSKVIGLSKTTARILSVMVWIIFIGCLIGLLLLTGGTRIKFRI